MKHLDVLSDAGLVAREKTGRVVACRLTAKPMEQALAWLNRYQRFWSDNLDRLAAFVEEEPWTQDQAPPATAGLVTKPSLTLTRHLKAPPERVYAAWTDPEKLIRWFGRADATAGSFKADIDARVGGRFRISFSTASEYYEVSGVYREVVPNARLVFSWAWHSTPERESQVTVAHQARRSGDAADAASRAAVR